MLLLALYAFVFYSNEIIRTKKHAFPLQLTQRGQTDKYLKSSTSSDLLILFIVFVTCSHVSQCPVELFISCNDGRFLSIKKIGKQYPLSYYTRSIRIIDRLLFAFCSFNIVIIAVIKSIYLLMRAYCYKKWFNYFTALL